MPLQEARQILVTVHEEYPKIAADLVEPLINFFTAARECVGGDSDKILLLLVISARTKRHPDFARYSTAELESGLLETLPSLGINARSLADSTGIPKETVRRKVAELVDAGLLVRIDHDLRFTPEGYRAVAPAREALEMMAVRDYQIVRGILGHSSAPDLVG